MKLHRRDCLSLDQWTSKESILLRQYCLKRPKRPIDLKREVFRMTTVPKQPNSFFRHSLNIYKEEQVVKRQKILTICVQGSFSNFLDVREKSVGQISIRIKSSIVFDPPIRLAWRIDELKSVQILLGKLTSLGESDYQIRHTNANQPLTCVRVPSKVLSPIARDFTL